MTPSINLDFPLNTALPPNNPSIQAHVVGLIRERIDAAKSPIIIVDGGTLPFLSTPDLESIVNV
jgi:pyruvate decarboxylase